MSTYPAAVHADQNPSKTKNSRGKRSSVRDTQTTILLWIAGILIAGAAWLLASILVPFVLGLILAIALSPLAVYLERAVGRLGSSLLCLLLVFLLLCGTAGLLAYQAGTIVSQSDRYLESMSKLLAKATSSVGGDKLMRHMGLGAATEGETGGQESGPHNTSPDSATESATSSSASRGEAKDETPSEEGPNGEGQNSLIGHWERFLRENLGVVGGWLLRGIGGFVGLIGSAVICLSFVFYLLETRSEWIDRMERLFRSLGLRPHRERLEEVQHSIALFGSFVVMVSIGGALVTGTTAWLLGLPQPFLWGLVFGLLEFIPYFGPMIGGSLLTLLALAMGGGQWWPPLVMFGVLLAWLTLEGYVITPMVYGRAVRFDPVTVLLAVLFFGWLWGPLGMVTALPMMVLLREFVAMIPESPALDALMEPEEKESGPSASAEHAMG
jgi:predicted PurR-regulated permease PerM